MTVTKEARGIAFIILANVAFTLMVCLVRVAQVENAGVTALFRFLCGILIVVLLSFTGKVQLVFNNKAGLLWRGMFGGVAVGLGLYGITKLGVVKASILINTYPLFATLFGSFILKEKLTLKTSAVLLLAFAGILMVIIGSGTGFSLAVDTPTLLTLLGGVIGGFAVVQVKELTRSESSIAIYVSQCLMGMLIMFFPATRAPLELSPNTLYLLLLIGAAATLGQLLITEGMRHVTIATSAILAMSGPVMTVLAGVLIFQEQVTTQMAWGIFMTLFALSTLAFRK